MSQSQLIYARIYWDSLVSDWAYVVRFADGREESGEYCDIHEHNSLAHAVDALCWQYGVDIDPESVYAEPKIEGGYAIWTRPEDTPNHKDTPQ